MKLINIYDQLNKATEILYKLLQERKDYQNISHKRLPSYEDHQSFIQSYPYRSWSMIEVKSVIVGAIYLTYNNEIGIHLFERYHKKGYGKQAVKIIMEEFRGPFLANINPLNEGSISMFKSLGFEHIQNTYRLDNE